MVEYLWGVSIRLTYTQESNCRREQVLCLRNLTSTRSQMPRGCLQAPVATRPTVDYLVKSTFCEHLMRVLQAQSAFRNVTVSGAGNAEGGRATTTALDLSPADGLGTLLSSPLLSHTPFQRQLESSYVTSCQEQFYNACLLLCVIRCDEPCKHRHACKACKPSRANTPCSHLVAR
jgi:hypothetical protein